MLTESLITKPIEIGVGVLPLPDGFGDIIGGYNLYCLVKQLYPNVTIDFSVLTCKDEQVINHINMINSSSPTKLEIKNYKDSNFDFIKEITEETEFMKKITNYAKVILFVGCHSDRSIPKEILNSCGNSLIRFREYGCIKSLDNTLSSDNKFTLGLRKDESGVFFNNDLWEYRKKRETMSKVQQLEQLISLPKHIVKAIFGCDNPTNENFDSFSHSSKLFVGYGFSALTIQMFFYGILGFENKKDIVIVLLNKPLNIEDWHSESFFDMIINTDGFMRYELHDYTSEGFTPRKYKSKKISPFTEERSLKLIFTRLPPNHTLNLFKSSEKQTLGTGDYSFFELVTMGSWPIYDCRPHKIGFIESFFEHLGMKNKGLMELYKRGCFGSDHEGYLEELKYIRDVSHFLKQPGMVDIMLTMKDFFMEMDRKEMHNAWDAAIEDLYNNCNLAKVLPNILKV